MSYPSRPPYRHVGRGAYHAPPRFRSPTNTLSTSTSTSIRRPLPPPPRNGDSSSGLSGPPEHNVTARLRSFEHHIPLKHDVKYTYAEIPSSPNIVYFFEYRGYGVPSCTLGSLGDVYIDLTENDYALYAKGVSDWARWTVAGWLEHPFLTDTVLGFLLDTVVWIHPMKVDRPSQAAELYFAIRDMLVHEEEVLRSNQVSRKQPETEDGESDIASGNGSRKRPRVDEEPSSTAHNLEPPSSPLSEPQIDEDLPPVDLAPAKITSSISQVDHTASYRPRKKSMDSRISVLQAEMAKLQEDLRELQLENSRVTLINKKLLDEMKTLQDINHRLRVRTGGYGKPVSADHAVDTPSAAISRGQSGPDGALAMCAAPNDKGVLGRFAQSMNGSSDTDASMSDVLPAHIQNRLGGHANNLISIMDEVVDTQLRLQRATGTIADQKRHIATLSAEVQTERDVRARMETEHKEREGRLQAMNAWLMHAPKFDQEGGG